jgi:hypothetical protein
MPNWGLNLYNRRGYLFNGLGILSNSRCGFCCGGFGVSERRAWLARPVSLSADDAARGFHAGSLA